MVTAVKIFGVGKSEVSPTVGPNRSLKSNDVAGVGYRQRLQGDPVVDAKQRGVDADTQCQSDHGDRGEARIVNQSPARMPEILQQLLQPDEGTLVAMQFLCLL